MALDLDRAHAIYHDDLIVEFPQSGERISGERNLYELRAHYPAKVTFKILRIRGEGNLWITELIITYDGRPVNVVTIMEFRDGKVVHETHYYADPFDRCDLRCVYCMSEDTQFLPREQLLTLEETARLGRCFSELGVKLRITGGEPLVRRNVVWLFEQLGALPGIRDLTPTTNGSQLTRFAVALKDAGVTRVNISLDSLRPERFRSITRNGELNKTLAGNGSRWSAGFERVKLNSVILKHRNHDEVVELVAFALDRGMDISFIEEMLLGVIGDHDRAEALLLER